MKAACYDCDLPYEEFGLDLILPDQQWKYIFPEFDGSGLLCARCIAKRCDEIRGPTVLLAWIDCIDYSKPRPERWLRLQGKTEEELYQEAESGLIKMGLKPDTTPERAIPSQP